MAVGMGRAAMEAVARAAGEMEEETREGATWAASGAEVSEPIKVAVMLRWAPMKMKEYFLV